MIAGVETQSSGEVWVDGQLICGSGFSQPPEERYIGLIPGFCFISTFDSMAKRWIWNLEK